MLNLLAYMGLPQEKLKVVHIAGSILLKLYELIKNNRI